MNFNIQSPIPDLGTVVGNAFDVLFALAGVVAMFYIIVGGYNYIASGGNPEMTEAAKATLTNAILGLILVLASYLIIGFLLSRLGATGFVGIF
jgi:glucan phosphoethanolaminetransferase (alkaline phosphatase superfamily)